MCSTTSQCVLTKLEGSYKRKINVAEKGSFCYSSFQWQYLAEVLRFKSPMTKYFLENLMNFDMFPSAAGCIFFLDFPNSNRQNTSAQGCTAGDVTC